MKIYIHKGQGHYIGSCFIVIADSLESAQYMIKTELVIGGLPNEQLSIDEIEITNNKLIHAENGDY